MFVLGESLLLLPSASLASTRPSVAGQALRYALLRHATQDESGNLLIRNRSFRFEFPRGLKSRLGVFDFARTERRPALTLKVSFVHLRTVISLVCHPEPFDTPSPPFHSAQGTQDGPPRRIHSENKYQAQKKP